MTWQATTKDPDRSQPLNRKITLPSSAANNGLLNYEQKVEDKGFMKQIKRILVPTDLSENSRRGLTYGFSVAEGSGAEVVVVHVASEFQTWEPYSDEPALISANLHPSLAGKVISEVTLDLNRFLEQHRDEMRQVRMLRKRVVLGFAAKKIVEVAEEEQADLIVMAPRPHRAIRHFFLGSVTDRVTREAPCPVLSVCPPRQARRWKGELVPSVWLPPPQNEAST